MTCQEFSQLEERIRVATMRAERAAQRARSDADETPPDRALRTAILGRRRRRNTDARRRA